MYTVGQRSGLRLQAGGPAMPPTYVSAIDAASNTVTVGGPQNLLRSRCRVEDVRYVAGHVPATAFRAGVKVRSHAPCSGALVTPLCEEARIEFDDPQRALAPRQGPVFYEGDRGVGGGPAAAAPRV